VKRRARRLAALTAVLLTAPALLALHFRDGPPARVTGGFGEDSCTACHFDHAANDGTGTLTLTGLPEQFVPGEAYELILSLTRPGLKVAGFQLAVRQSGDRSQAGTIAVPAEQAHVALLEERGVQFAHHDSAASPATDGDVVRWKLSWTASETTGPVAVHAAAVAGDGDESQAGDFVYTLELASRPDLSAK
jgi:hypothetical protein